MKVQTVGSVSEFLRGNYAEQEPFSVKAERHFKKYGTAYRIAGVTAIILMSAIPLGGGSVTAFASSGIDIEARKLYTEIVKVGKWIIIFKGAIDIIKALGDGDNISAKKTFISSLLTFLILLGLPYGMDKVSEIFDKISPAPTTSTRGW
jgi:hypothetical protein